MNNLKEYVVKGKSHRIGATIFVSGLILVGLSAGAETIRLDQLAIRNTDQDWGQPHAGRSVDGHPLKIWQ
jgi:hypothetical protein